MKMLRYVLLTSVAIAVGLSSGASAQTKKPKRKPAAAPAAAAVQHAPCDQGMRYVDGACVSENQVRDALYARAMAQCAAQIRINYNSCALGHFGPNAKDIFVYDQGLQGIQSSPGG